MKAVFKGYKAQGYYDFTVGKIYDLMTDAVTNGYAKVTDDRNFTGTFIPGDIYDFEVIESSESSEFVVKVDNFNKKATGIKYFINGVNFCRDEFTDIKNHVSNLESAGVKCDTIIFEVKFE